ncbi:MAG TPA: fibronectin type III-like domain-contianing protein, partial [Bacteroidales bacterium]|nr:fibronectin type III-like domain-contianing protein [Bacteroidales bacterium]
LFPFGYGQSYTTYNYSDIKLSDTVIDRKGHLEAMVNVTNTGSIAGEEVVQLYIRDDVSSVTRPVLELKDFARVHLEPGETKQVPFTITPEKLRFYNKDMKRVVEPGRFHVYIGPDSQHLKSTTFMVKGKR